MLREMNSLRIGPTLKKLMTEDRHTLTALSKATGVPKSTISEWLNNRAPNPVQASKGAQYFKVSPHFLLFGEEDSEEPPHKILKEELFSGTFEISIKRLKILKGENK